MSRDRIQIHELGKASASTGTRLREAIGGGRYHATLIQAGWGSSGYYSEECLRMSGHKAFPQGTHMYLNHSTEAEDRERPERDMRDLVGTIASMPRMEGIDLTSDVQVYPHWQPVIESMAKDTGLSIRSMGLAEEGAAGGKEGMIIHELLADDLNSVDYVTIAGAGGKVHDLIEGARNEEADWDDVLRESPSGLLVVEVAYEDGLEISREERIALAEKGQAIPVRNASGDVINGRFPITSTADVQRVAEAIGTAEAQSLKSFISRVAAKLGSPAPFSESGGDPSRTTKEAQVADDERLKRLEESVQALETRATEAEAERETAKAEAKEAQERADRAEDKLLAREAEKVVDATLTDLEEAARTAGTGLLPERAAKRVRESALREAVPTVKDGNDKVSIDEAKIKERVTTLEKEEREYLLPSSDEGTEGSPVREAGGREPFAPQAQTENGTTDDKETKELAESLQGLGLSEDAAQVAARGR